MTRQYHQHHSNRTRAASDCENLQIDVHFNLVDLGICSFVCSKGGRWSAPQHYGTVARKIGFYSKNNCKNIIFFVIIIIISRVAWYYLEIRGKHTLMKIFLMIPTS